MTYCLATKEYSSIDKNKLEITYTLRDEISYEEFKNQKLIVHLDYFGHKHRIEHEMESSELLSENSSGNTEEYLLI